MWIIALASFSAFCAVVMGALTDHMLAHYLNNDGIARIQTALHYQFIHALALLAVGILSMQKNWFYSKLTATFFVIGILCFSGGLYIYTLLGVQAVIHIIPFGGLSFLAGWLTLFIASIKFKKE